MNTLNGCFTLGGVRPSNDHSGVIPCWWLSFRSPGRPVTSLAQTKLQPTYVTVLTSSLPLLSNGQHLPRFCVPITTFFLLNIKFECPHAVTELFSFVNLILQMDRTIFIGIYWSPSPSSLFSIILISVWNLSLRQLLPIPVCFTADGPPPINEVCLLPSLLKTVLLQWDSLADPCYTHTHTHKILAPLTKLVAFK